MVSVPTVVPVGLLLWGLSCAKGAFLCLSRAPAPRTPAPQRGMVPEQLLVSDRQVIRLQVWGQKHPLCPRPMPATLDPPLPLCLGAPGVCLVSWPGASGPTRHLGDASRRPGPPAAPAYLRGRRGLLAHTCSGSPGGFSPLGQGEGAAEAPVLPVGWSPQPLPVTWFSM